MELESGSRPITYADSKAALSACRDLQSSVWNVRLGLTADLWNKNVDGSNVRTAVARDTQLNVSDEAIATDASHYANGTFELPTLESLHA